MVLQYESESRWQALLPVLNDHIEWLHDVLHCLFYAETPAACENIQKPVSFAQWTVVATDDEGVQPEAVEKLTSLHRDLFAAADAMMALAKATKTKPEHDIFKNFMTVYEEFLSAIRRLEKDFMEADSGYDSFTGLRSTKFLVYDIERELERLSRKGKNFALAMARIDNYAEIKQQYSKSEYEALVKLVSNLIKISIRSFDDAYYYGEDKFVLLLKQADIQGGIAALERLRRELERNGIVYKLAFDEKPISMSCCIAEPVDGDNIQEILKNLKDDLDSHTNKRADAVLEYYELSPLQRYVQDSGRR